MMSIYLCDDEHIWLQRIEKAITSYQLQSNWNIHIAYQGTSPEELLRYLREQKPTGGIYFLDIDLKSQISGLDLAVQIRKQDSKASIIFVTTHDEMVMETFRLKVSALEFIVKDAPSPETQIAECLAHLEASFSDTGQDTNIIRFRTNNAYYTVDPQKVYYVETIKSTHKVRLHLSNGFHDIHCSLSAIRQQAGEDFYLCHKAYLVNLRHIVRLDADNHTVILDNGDSCPCSVREWRKLTKVFCSHAQ